MRPLSWRFRRPAPSAPAIACARSCWCASPRGEGRASRAVLAQDLAPLVAHRLPLAQWRALIDREIEGLLADGLAIEAGAHLAVSDAGSASARRFLGLKGTLPRAWERAASTCVWSPRRSAWSASRPSASRRWRGPTVCGRPSCRRAYGLKIKGIATPVAAALGAGGGGAAAGLRQSDQGAAWPARRAFGQGRAAAGRRSSRRSRATSAPTPA